IIRFHAGKGAIMTCSPRRRTAFARQFDWNRITAAFAAVLVASGTLLAQDAQDVDPDLAKKRALQSELGAIASMKHETETFGKTADGHEVKVHKLTNLKGLRVRLIDYGATLISVEAPDKSGKNANITLGFPTLDGYLQRHPFFGSIAG